MATATETRATKGLVFVHFIANMKYVLRPAARQVIDGIPHNRRALRADFKHHRWDSLQAQKNNHWTDEERVMLEQYLLDHNDFGRPRGLSLEGHTLDAMREAQVAIPQMKLRCAAFFPNPSTGESEQCTEEPLEDEDYCSKHKAEIDAIVAQQMKAEREGDEAPESSGDADFLGADSLPGDTVEPGDVVGLDDD